MEQLAQQLLKEAEALAPQLAAWRRTIHAAPEAGPHLPRTAAYVRAALADLGLSPESPCESGVTALLSGEKPGPCVLLRADMDALPGREESGLPFRSENGAMHACGHDMHTAMLLGAARLLLAHRDRLRGQVKLVFQPDEEGFTGAKTMLAAGVLQAPTPKAALALHVHSGTPTGLVLCGRGTFMAGCTLFRVTVTGTGCHGAMPETGVDPLNIAAHIYLALQALPAREISAKDPAVITVGRFAGGDAPNIIPQTAVLEGTIRTFDQALTDRIFTRIGEISAATAAAFRGQARVEELASAPPLVNDPALMDTVAGFAGALFGKDRVYTLDEGGMGSEDFAAYTHRLPCAYLLLGAGQAEEDPAYGKPMHNAAVVFNEAVLPRGAALLAYAAIGLLDRDT